MIASMLGTLARGTSADADPGSGSVLDALFGLKDMSFADADQITFASPLPSWVWAVVVVLVLGASVWSYARLSGSRWARLLLAGLRTLLVLVLVALIAGPQLTQRVDTLERDWVVVLIDRSASLSVQDVPAGSTRQTRDQQLRAALEASSQTFQELAENREIVYIGFDRTATPLAVDADGLPVLTEATGLRTSFSEAFSEAIERTAARPVAGIVVVSDGRSLDEPDRAAWRTLRGERVPVIAVPLGATEPIGDLRVTRVESPPSAFVNDGIPVRVRVESVGRDPSQGGYTLKLIDAEQGTVIDERTVSALEALDTSEHTLRVASDTQGERRYLVRVESDRPDLVPGNNEQALTVRYTARAIRVLFVDGYPRWEQRYLRQLLIRERTLDASTLILAPDRRYMQEGDTLIDRIPDTPQDWAPYDVIVLGDVRPDVFTSAQLESMREHIAQRGAGLILSGGPSAMPRTWYDTALAELLPFTRDASDGTPIAGAALLQRTPDADRLGLLRLNDPGEADPWPAELASEDTGWSLLRYVQRIQREQLKPATRTLANADPVLGGADTPVVMAMRFGAGSVIYVATDEIWRWRFGRGEVLFERFWLQLIRSLGRDRLERSGVPIVLSASPEQATVGEPVRLSLTVLDQSIVDRASSDVSLNLSRASDLDVQTPVGELSLDRLGVVDTTSTELTDAVYLGVWTPSATGVFTFTLSETDAATFDIDDLPPTVTVRVALPDDELRNAAADHDAMRALATRTDGSLLSPENLSDLPTLLPNRERRQSFDRSEALWDTPLVLVLILVLTGLEWIGRRLVRLT